MTRTGNASAPAAAAGVSDDEYAEMQEAAQARIEEIGLMDLDTLLLEIQSTLDHARILADGLGYSDNITTGESILLTGVERLSLMLEGALVWIEANVEAAEIVRTVSRGGVSEGDGHL